MLLGGHVEMKKTKRQLYPIGTTFQPDEHSLPLAAGRLADWHNACEALGDHPHHDVHDEFIIEPLGPLSLWVPITTRPIARLCTACSSWAHSMCSCRIFLCFIR